MDNYKITYADGSDETITNAVFTILNGVITFKQRLNSIWTENVLIIPTSSVKHIKKL